MSEEYDVHPILIAAAIILLTVTTTVGVYRQYEQQLPLVNSSING